MSRLSSPPSRYDPVYETERNKVIEGVEDAAYTGDADLILPPELGIVMHSPDGTPWRVTVDNTGALVVSAYTP